MNVRQLSFAREKVIQESFDLTWLLFMISQRFLLHFGVGVHLVECQVFNFFRLIPILALEADDCWHEVSHGISNCTNLIDLVEIRHAGAILVQGVYQWNDVVDKWQSVGDESVKNSIVVVASDWVIHAPSVSVVSPQVWAAMVQIHVERVNSCHQCSFDLFLLEAPDISGVKFFEDNHDFIFLWFHPVAEAFLIKLESSLIMEPTSQSRFVQGSQHLPGESEVVKFVLWLEIWAHWLNFHWFWLLLPALVVLCKLFSVSEVWDETVNLLALNCGKCCC